MNFRPFGFQLGLAIRPQGLGQGTGLDPSTGPMSSEPSLEAALAPLSSDERADYKTWGSKEKLLFIAAYQWIAVAAAQGLRRADGSPFTGFLSNGVMWAMGALSTMAQYFGISSVLQNGADLATTILDEATKKTVPQADAIAKKYRLLRDRVAWEFALAGTTIEYEIVGDDPAAPGLIYTRRVGGDVPDYSAVFSGDTPREAWQNGRLLEDKFEAAGVSFKKLDLSGANQRLGIGAPPILAVLITSVVAILAFFWLYNHVGQTKKLTQTAIDLITGDTKLSGAEKAALIEKLKSSSSFFDDIFGSQFPWTTVLIGATLVGIAYFVLPSLLLAYTAKPAYQPRGATA